MSESPNKLWAAFVLGHHGYYVRVWQYVAYDLPGADNVWDSVPLALDEIRKAAIIVADRLGGGQVAFHTQISDLLRTLNASSQATSPGTLFRDNLVGIRNGDAPGEDTWCELLTLLDGFFGSNDCLRLLFNFGKAVGKCHLESKAWGQAMARAAADKQYVAQAEACFPNLEALVRLAKEIGSLGILDVPVIRELSEIELSDDVERTAVSVVTALKKEPWTEPDTDFPANPLDDPLNRHMFPLGLLLAMEEIYQNMEQPLRTRVGVAKSIQCDDKDRERDHWIYQELQAGRKQAAVLRDLHDKSTSEGWAPITTVNGLKRAAIVCAERYGYPPLTQRKPGRPRKQAEPLKSSIAS